MMGASDHFARACLSQNSLLQQSTVYPGKLAIGGLLSMSQELQEASNKLKIS